MEIPNYIRVVNVTGISYRDHLGDVHKIIGLGGTILRSKSLSNNGPTVIETDGTRWWDVGIGIELRTKIALPTQNVEDIT